LKELVEGGGQEKKGSDTEKKTIPCGEFPEGGDGITSLRDVQGDEREA